MPGSAPTPRTRRSWTPRLRPPSGGDFGPGRPRFRPRFPSRRDPRPSPTTVRKLCRTVVDWVRYYAIVGAGRTAQTPSGLARRRAAGTGPVDEAVRVAVSWDPAAAIGDWGHRQVGADHMASTGGGGPRLI